MESASRSTPTKPDTECALISWIWMEVSHSPSLPKELQEAWFRRTDNTFFGPITTGWSLYIPSPGVRPVLFPNLKLALFRFGGQKITRPSMDIVLDRSPPTCTRPIWLQGKNL